MEMCVVKARVTAERSVRQRCYAATFTCNETEETILSVQSEDSAAHLGASATLEQNDCPLWYELRYGRITASKAYDAVQCNVFDGTLTQTILAAKRFLCQDLCPGIKTGFTKFCCLRPAHCNLANAGGTHTVCACPIHDNMKLMASGAPQQFKKGKHFSNITAMKMLFVVQLSGIFLQRCMGKVRAMVLGELLKEWLEEQAY
ncbi:hypothetical protein EVAR_64469_1 [Eumeta japonica]|uniref:Uncharacterized protein n=1 Tax=Eumeta variegata TaxID=151549 RepID=A0A4C1ZJ75_EUMVA|nr:hypothetical protein EVAR_64469_1 [Eumeta japonica]